MKFVRACVPLLVAATCASAPACRRPPPPVATYQGAPVILISIDTLRADRVGVYGYKGARTPNIDALAADAVRFADVYSAAPLTLPAHATLFTGKLPPRHGVRDNLGFTLDPSQKTLASTFKAAGYATGGAVSAYVLRHQTGISQGFDFYDDALVIEGSGEVAGDVQRDGAVAVEALAGWVEAQGAGKPLFAFLHLYEPHAPYAPPARFSGAATPYDGDVSYADELVGRFLERLRKAGVFERALVVLTADHGEGLNDHGEAEHGIFLYRESLHVPLLVRLPGGAARGTLVTGTASQADIAATILDLAGAGSAAHGDDGLDGRTLRAAIARGRTDGAPAYSETLYPRHQFGWSELYSVSEEKLRYIRAPKPEIYDLGADPGERQNLIAARAAAVGPLNAFVDKVLAAGKPAEPEEVPAEVREKLAALGYVGLSFTPQPEGTALADPKDKIAGYQEYLKALRLRQQGNTGEAIAGLRRVVAENPRMIEAWTILGTTLAADGRSGEGIAALSRAVALDPQRPEIHTALAKIYALQGNTAKALPHAEIASARDPGAGAELVAQILMDAGRPRDAAAFAKRSIAADPERIMGHFILGDIARRAGRYAEALADYRRAETAKARRRQAIVRNLYYNMGDCLARLGQNAEAEAMFRRELQQLPSARDPRLALALLYRSEGRDADVRTVLAELIAAEQPPTADTYATVLGTLAMLGDREGAAMFAQRARQAFPQDGRFR